MRWLHRHYGAGPVHLVGLLAACTVAAYAVTRVFGQGGWKSIVLWFGACVIVHDVIGWPLYALADHLLVRTEHRHRGRRPVPWINHVRVPVVMSTVLLGIAFPLIFRLSASYYEATTGFNENAYLVHWLEVTGFFFAVSGLFYLLRLCAFRARSAPSHPADDRNDVD